MYYIRRNTHTFLHIIWIKCMSIVKYYNKCSTLDILYIFTCYIQFVNSWNLKVGFLCNNNKSRWSPWILLQTNHRLHGTRCKKIIEITCFYRCHVKITLLKYPQKCINIPDLTNIVFSYFVANSPSSICIIIYR